MYKKTQQPVRLHRAAETTSILEKDIIIRISVYTAILIALAIFVGLCFIMTSPTYGFLWY